MRSHKGLSTWEEGEIALAPYGLAFHTFYLFLPPAPEWPNFLQWAGNLEGTA